MCGIAGTFSMAGAPAEIAVLQRMAKAIAHRGPDGEGFLVDGPLGFAHRRLAIIDLSPSGHQPMQTADGRFVITYNGELYNFQELRIELEALGHGFRSRGDTEVVLAALAQWGLDALPRLNGMFAFALWDRKARRLVLARDRYGVKPLYVTQAGDTILFASEIKAMLTHPDMVSRMDAEALVEYMTFQNFLTDRTLFAGVRVVEPGSWMSFDADGTTRRGRYWDFDFREPEARRSDAAYEEELDHLFRQAVSRQLIADVPVGAYLSGGMDSGSIAAVAARQLDLLRTFTIGFDMHSVSGMELAYDERSVAEHMSYLFKTEQYEMVLKAGDMERCMQRLVWHLEEPRVGQSYPNYYAAQLASKFNKVVLAGTGGDELFGGYPWRYYRAVVNNDFDDYIDKYLAFWQRIVPAEIESRIFRPIAAIAEKVSVRDIFASVFHTHAAQMSRPEDYINHSLYFEAKTFLHGLLIVEDKLSMAHSLESRVPFLDNDLVDFAMRLPVGLKLGNLGEVVRLNENEPGSKTRKFFERTRDGKLILRKVMRRHVPDQVSDAIKQGFSAPDATWFRGESIDYIRDTLYARNARIYDVLDREAIVEILDQHLNGQKNHRLLIWSLLNLEEWCRQFLEQGPKDRR